jgi:hypothetical protein
MGDIAGEHTDPQNISDPVLIIGSGKIFFHTASQCTLLRRTTGCTGLAIAQGLKKVY